MNYISVKLFRGGKFIGKIKTHVTLGQGCVFWALKRLFEDSGPEQESLTSSINTTRELLRKSDLWATPRPTELKTLGMGPNNLCSKEPSGDGYWYSLKFENGLSTVGKPGRFYLTSVLSSHMSLCCYRQTLHTPHSPHRPL